MSDNPDDWGAYARRGKGRPKDAHGAGYSGDSDAEIKAVRDPNSPFGYAIQDDVPFPEELGRQNKTPLRQTMDMLQPGQSFKFFGSRDYMRCKNALSSIRKLDKTKEYTIRRQEKVKQGEYFYRVWRTK